MFWKVSTGLIGGLGLFLFGMQIMASGMQKAAGDKLRKILEVLTSNSYIAVLTGIVVTVLIQSSSTTTVMVVGFANAGLMTLNQAVGTILGANIGTTVTAQAISFKIEVVALPAIGIGAILNFFSRRRLKRYIGQTVLGFGLLFLGMTTMSSALSPLRESTVFLNMLANFGRNPFMGVLAGAIFTAAIQSSSAATGVIIALSIQELLTFPSALTLILGTNIGTCITALLASMGTSLSAKRAALAHILFNLMGVSLFLLFINPFSELMVETASTVPRQIANAHTIFNVTSTILVLPFFKYFIHLINRIIPGEEGAIDLGPKFLDKRMLKTPAVAIGTTHKEVLRMASLAREMVRDSINAFIKEDHKLMVQVYQKEEILDSLEKEITIYLAELAQHSLTQEQSNQVTGLMHAVNDLERIGDHSETIIHLAEAKVGDKLPFSEEALNQLRHMYERVDWMLDRVMEAFEKNDYFAARSVIEEDDVIDNLEKTLRKHHIERINEKKCNPTSGVIYLDLLSNFERIADHATNIAQVVLGEF
ncbi:MAG: sodium:solute symporter [Firmicutes bacterium HGW-Firmicutes-13]|nr:MAG: sodium:solute symporter [Firmicutes bacterium HGW-Firmicutes-13]